MMVFCKVDYYPAQKGREYRVLSEGTDWFLIKIRGGQFYIPKTFFDMKDFYRERRK